MRNPLIRDNFSGESGKFMAYYRLYFIQRGHFVRCRDFHAADDAEASGKAAMFAGPDPMELWCGGRQVQRFDASHGQERARGSLVTPPRQPLPG
jgi:hypothetical protein